MVSPFRFPLSAPYISGQRSGCKFPLKSSFRIDGRETTGTQDAPPKPRSHLIRKNGRSHCFMIQEATFTFALAMKKQNKTKTNSSINLHTVSSITNPSSWAHPRAFWGQHNIINCPGVSSCGVVGLNPSEPCPGRSNPRKHTWVDKQTWDHENMFSILFNSSKLILTTLHLDHFTWFLLWPSIVFSWNSLLKKSHYFSHTRFSECLERGKQILNYPFILLLNYTQNYSAF